MIDKVLNLFLKSFKRNEITGYEAFRLKGNKKFPIAPSIVMILQIIHHSPYEIIHLNQETDAKPTTVLFFFLKTKKTSLLRIQNII